MSLSPGFRRFAVHTGMFLVLFILFSGITGPHIVASRLLYGFGFYIYGNLGKMVLFGLIVFLLLVRKRLPEMGEGSLLSPRLGLAAAAFAFIPVFNSLGSRLLAEKAMWSNPSLTLITHAFLLFQCLLLLFSVFPPKFISSFWTIYHKPFIICLLIAIGYDLAIFRIWSLWPVFSTGVLSAVRLLTGLFYPTIVTPPLTLTVGTFSVQILQACSGLDSLFLFSTLYLIIAILDWKEFHKARIILMFFPVALGLYAVNILRVFLIVIFGAAVSPAIALNLFHTYLGMLLFIGYFALFMKIFYRWMKR